MAAREAARGRADVRTEGEKAVVRREGLEMPPGGGATWAF